MHLPGLLQHLIHFSRKRDAVRACTGRTSGGAAGFLTFLLLLASANVPVFGGPDSKSSSRAPADIGTPAAIFTDEKGLAAALEKELEVRSFLTHLRKQHAPDARLVVWEIAATLNDDPEQPRTTVTGFTDNAEVLGALQRAVRSRHLQAEIHVGLLPDDDPAVGDKSWALVSVPTASLLHEPSFAASTVTQAVTGTPLRVLQKAGPFWRAQTPDGYIGWVHGMQIRRLTVDELSNWNAAAKIVVTSRSTVVTDAAGNILAPLPAAGMAKIISFAPGQRRIQVQLPDNRTGFVNSSDVRDARQFFRNWETLRAGPADQFYAALLQNARMLTGTSYLWGGASTDGVDCSGFISLLWRLTGVIIPRDADQQIAAATPMVDGDFTAGTNADGMKSIPAGALLAFGKRSKTGGSPVIEHVALSLGSGNFIHSLGSVRVESLDPASAVYSNYERGRLLGVRWINPTITDVPCASTYATNGFYQSPPRPLSPCRLPAIVQP